VVDALDAPLQFLGERLHGWFEYAALEVGRDLDGVHPRDDAGPAEEGFGSQPRRLPTGAKQCDWPVIWTRFVTVEGALVRSQGLNERIRALRRAAEQPPHGSRHLAR